MGKKLLIAEDDKELYEMFKLKFQKGGFEVFIAENGFDAISTAVNEKPDIILLDIMMPNMDGFETLQTLRQQTSLDTKIFVFSNLKTNQHIEQAKQLGADDYLVKADYTPSQVYQKVVDILGLEGESTKGTQETPVHKCPHCGEELNITVNKKLN